MQKATQGRANKPKDIENDDGQYRLRQFYAILLKADKARLLVLRERTEGDKFEEQNKADCV